MKINWFLFCIALALAALGAFGFYMGNAGETYRALIAAGSGLSLFVTLGGLFALSSPHGGTANIKAVTGLFFIVLLIEHIVFSVTGVLLTPYIVITGVLLLVYVLVCYAIIRALK
jgi:hypothetical protein